MMKHLLQIWWWLRRLPTPRDGYRVTKWFIQRGWRGWSDRDSWSMYSYVGPVLADMLKDLREKGHGYHCVHGEYLREQHMMDSSLCGPEDWWALLHRIEFGLRYYEYVYDGDCYEHYSFDGWRARAESSQEVIVMAFADLAEYWGGMWD